MDDNDNEKSVDWFRKALKTGGIAGGIAGFVCGTILAPFSILARGIVMHEVPPRDMETWVTAAATFIGCALGGIGGGCVGGIAAGRLFKEKSYFGVLAKIAGVIGGVVGIVGWFVIWMFCRDVIWSFCRGM
jgi:hypothetical protein